MRTDFDAIVVGAGPAGSSAAILLARAGWRVALVEKQGFPRRKVCGECIAASNMPLLAALGLAPDIGPVTGPALSRVVLMRLGESVTARLPPAMWGHARFGIALSREVLDTHLLEQARSDGVQVYQPWSVEATGGAPGDWSCTLRAVGGDDRVVLRAKVAIDAHGSWESLASARAKRVRPKRRSDLFAFKANFRDASLAGETIAVLAFDGGYGGMVVSGDGVTTVACCIRRDRLEACRTAFPGVDAGTAVQAYLTDQCDDVRAALAQASRDGAWLASGPIDPGLRLPGTLEPFRIGNAAGEAHPIVGEGISMAIQGAWLLCQGLIDRGCPATPPSASRQRAIAASFAHAWRMHFRRRLRIAAIFANIAMRPLASMGLMAILRRWPQLLTLGAKWAGKDRCAVDPHSIAALSIIRTAPRHLSTDADRSRVVPEIHRS